MRWFIIRVDLVDGRSVPALWPRPGRVLVARPDMTFRMLAEAIDQAFARWGPPRPHTFTLEDGTRITQDVDGRERLTRLALGERFAYEQGAGADWSHLCTVDTAGTDPLEILTTSPDRPTVIDGWGTLPDPSGRAEERLRSGASGHGGDSADRGDGDPAPLPDRPEPPLSDLPDLLPWWGDGARELAAILDLEDDPDSGPADEPWDSTGLSRLRTAIDADDLSAILELFTMHDAFEVVHLVGPALARAAAAGIPEARAPLDPLLELLEERDEPGDSELAGMLRAALAVGAEAAGPATAAGTPPQPMRDDGSLVPTPVDLATLAAVLDGPADPAFAWRLEVATGRLIAPNGTGTGDATEPGADQDPVTVVGSGGREQLDDLLAFLGLDLDGGPGAAHLRAGAPRAMWTSIEEDLLRDPEHHHQWTVFAQERRLGRARRWLTAHGLRTPFPWE